MPKTIPREFIRAIPKTDLHVHLDGSLRVATLIELAREYKVELPSYTEAGLRETVYKETYQSLADYLRGFQYTCGVMQTAEALERIAYELGVDSFAEGVRYIEPRFAPQLHTHPDLKIAQVLQAVHRGLERAKREFNSRPEVAAGEEPPYHYGIIVCAMRLCGPAYSRYYHSLFNVVAYMPEIEIIKLASEELARVAVAVRDERGVPIVGFDLAGREDGYPAHDHQRAFQYAHQNFMHKTVHAGEAYGPESIFEAITLLHADRIGHGYYIFDASKISAPAIADKKGFVKALSDYIAERRITIEICLTSNLQTNTALRTLKNHPLRQMLDHRLSTTICTDNRLMSWTSVSNEIELAVKELNLNPRELKNSTIYGFKRSFMGDNYIDKRRYVRKIIDYYEQLERKFGVGELRN